MDRRVLVSSLVLGVMTTVAVHAQAQAGANRAAAEKQIVAGERAINDAVAKGDMKAFHAIVSPDAAGIDATGITKINAPDFDKMMQQAKIQSWDIDGSQFYWINDNTAVHMYRWSGKGTFGGQPVPSPVWSSTVWTNKGGKWAAVFHQETVAMAPPQDTPVKTPAKPLPKK